MFNRYIENIWKIFAVFIKKKLSKRKTMATVNRRKKQSWWEYNHAMPLFSSKQRWVKKKKSGKGPIIRILGGNGKNDTK